MPEATASQLMASTVAGEAIPLVDGKLYLCGSVVPLDGRVSWVPPDATGFQAVNLYALIEGGEALVIETGLACHQPLVIEQLASVVPEGTEVKVFLTRAEMDVISNLGAINARFGVSDLITGGLGNPFDAFDDANSVINRGRRRQIDDRLPTGDSILRSTKIELTDSRYVEIESPVLRFLPTFWGWDEVTRTLFTSDIFCHTSQDHADDPRVLDPQQEDSTTIDSAEAFLFAKFEWLDGADTEAFRRYLVETFDRRQPEIVAPTRGCVLKGREVVERHLALMLDVLSESRATARRLAWRA